jgi:hypothetical protein
MTAIIPELNKLTPIELVYEYQQWRKTGEGDRPSLRSLDLRRLDLHAMDLRGADLCGSDLRRSNLRGSNLSSADLRGSHLICSDMSYVDLSRANLKDSDMSYADMSYANMFRADMSCANLYGANLQGTNVGDANLRDADLSFAYGWIFLTQTDHGYTVGASWHDDHWRIQAGCRDFTIEEARNHWGDYDYELPSSGLRIIAMLNWLEQQPTPPEPKKEVQA